MSCSQCVRAVVFTCICTRSSSIFSALHFKSVACRLHISLCDGVMMFTVKFSWQVVVFVLFSALSVRLCGDASSHRGFLLCINLLFWQEHRWIR